MLVKRVYLQELAEFELNSPKPELEEVVDEAHAHVEEPQRHDVPRISKAQRRRVSSHCGTELMTSSWKRYPFSIPKYNYDKVA